MVTLAQLEFTVSTLCGCIHSVNGMFQHQKDCIVMGNVIRHLDAIVKEVPTALTDPESRLRLIDALSQMRMHFSDLDVESSGAADCPHQKFLRYMAILEDLMTPFDHRAHL